MRTGSRVIEPLPYVHSEASSFQEIQHRSAEAFADPFGRFSMTINVNEVILGKALKLRPQDLQPVRLWIQSNRTVGRRSKSVPECRLEQVRGEHLTNALQGVDRFLKRFGREAVHEIGMHENPGRPKSRGHTHG